MLKQRKYQADFRPISSDCPCPTCKSYTRAYLHSIAGREAVACHLISIHNVAFQVCVCVCVCVCMCLCVCVCVCVCVLSELQGHIPAPRCGQRGCDLISIRYVAFQVKCVCVCVCVCLVSSKRAASPIQPLPLTRSTDSPLTFSPTSSTSLPHSPTLSPTHSSSLLLVHSLS
jgi:hypothetical protein